MEILGTEMLMVRSKGGAVHRGEKDAMGTDWTFPSERVRHLQRLQLRKFSAFRWRNSVQWGGGITQNYTAHDINHADLSICEFLIGILLLLISLSPFLFFFVPNHANMVTCLCDVRNELEIPTNKRISSISNLNWATRNIQDFLFLFFKPKFLQLIILQNNN